jgi:glycosyltransferase involved in cell wall biosynthesis
MRIVIDMQGAQSASRGRGIGRYTMSLVDAIVRLRGEHEIILALNGLFEDTIAPIRQHFATLLPVQNVRVWQAPGPVRECEQRTRTHREAAELVREAFLVSLRPDLIHVTSLIEGYVDDAVTSIGRFDRSTPVSVSFYDLIPLVYRDHYLAPDPLYSQYYLRKLDHMRRADLLLAISESSRREAIELVDYPEAQVVNVSTAADAQFRPMAMDETEKQALLAKYGINRPFIMYTGATDSRKNVEGLIGAYSLLPENLRSRYQLLIVSHLHPAERKRFEALASMRYLLPGEMVLPGFAPDEDLVKLYNLCTLFVMPSWHEGFGLPVLEAMSCGKAAIASNASSLPEVVGRADALFDAKNERAIAGKITEALSNDAWRAELEAHGLEQAKVFSWDISAKRAIAAFEDLHAKRQRRTEAAPAGKKTLAFVSPLPPERTGIANYSAELLPALREHYDITLITEQANVSLPAKLADLPLQSAAWFAQHADRFDRILYQVGNSPYHSHMPELMRRHPGVLVLHDFFVSSMLAADELEQRRPRCWSDALYHSHGYPALAVRHGDNGIAEAKDRYPCNLSLLQDAAGIIVHSAHSTRLASGWYGGQASADWAYVPHLRVATPIDDRAMMRRAAREQLGLTPDRFLVCSFGFIAPTKLTHRLLDAWLQSALHGDRQCELVLVGENHGGDYGAQLAKRIEQSGARKNDANARIRIAGWTEMREYQLYLQAADISVQLRCTSRGETSGAVLDCMNHALPTVVNAHGSMADLPESAVWMLEDKFADADLVAALETLWRDTGKRGELAREARKQITTTHDPSHCARLYAHAIERFQPLAQQGTAALVKRLGATVAKQESELRRLANTVAQSLPPQPRVPQLMIDVSAICKSDLQTGIERVVRAQLSALLDQSSSAFRVEPVYLSSEGGTVHYRYARRYTHGLLGIPADIAEDTAVDVAPGDVFYGADFCPSEVIKAAAAGVYRRWREAGAGVHFLVHDILPVTQPEFFPEGAGTAHAAWLRSLAAEADSLICISQAVADDAQAWLKSDGVNSSAAFPVLHHGADLDRSFPSAGMPDDASRVLDALRGANSFLMVGTIEPRKGHLQAIEAFEILWREGLDAKLVIVGREGWTQLAPAQRRNIPHTMDKLRRHPELGRRLVWLSDISDQYLEQVYQASSCLLFASEAEGFGLPLIEAARHGKPIVARDIAVFREIAGEHAHYFAGHAPDALARALHDWIALDGQGKVPTSSGMAWNTWGQNAERLLRLLGL